MRKFLILAVMLFSMAAMALGTFTMRGYHGLPWGSTIEQVKKFDKAAKPNNDAGLSSKVKAEGFNQQFDYHFEKGKLETVYQVIFLNADSTDGAATLCAKIANQLIKEAGRPDAFQDPDIGLVLQWTNNSTTLHYVCRADPPGAAMLVFFKRIDEKSIEL